jgi:uncharacterized membrane protein YfhO
MDEENLFALQNNIWKAMVGNAESELFYPAHIEDIVLKNLEAEKAGEGFRYIKQNQDAEAFIEYYIVAQNKDLLYAQFPVSHVHQPVEMYVNDTPLGVGFSFANSDGFIELGSFVPGEVVVFKLDLAYVDEVTIDAALFYHQDMAAFTKYYEELSASPFQINNFTDSYFEGEIMNSGDKQYALFTIPYDKGWKVHVDGKPVSAIKVFDALIAVEIPEDTHNITLKYVSIGLYWGIAISIFSGLIICYCSYLTRRGVRHTKISRRSI